MEWADWIFKYLGLTPAHLWAMVAGTLVCLGVMQGIKKWLPGKDFVRAATAFTIGAFATYTLAPPMGVTFDWTALWMGIIVGLWTPSGFKVFKVIGRKRGWAWVNEL